MESKKRLKGQLNKGFSLFTVIIAVSFVMILGLLVIYISVSNFYMKVTDLKGKDSFYTAEQGLEEIKVGLQQDVGTAMSKAFTEVMENYDRDSGSGNAQDTDRQDKYRELFIKYLKETLKISEIPGEYDPNIFDNEKYLNKSNVLTDESRETLMVASNASHIEYIDSKNSGIILKNLKVVYVDSKGRASIIKTDISLGTPKAQFPTSSTLPDLMSMVVVANGGIVCESPDTVNTGTPNDSNAITLRGNIYAGLLQDKDNIICNQINNNYGNTKADYGHKTSIWIKSGAQLNVESGEKFVSRAEVNVDHSSLKINSGVGFWTRGITVGSSVDKSANVKLLGTSYVADDLTIASGSNAYVDIEGNYYGYGSEASVEELKTNSEYSKEEYYKQYTDQEPDSYSTSDLSSSIIINGKNATLDISKVQKMELSGKSYISTSKLNTSNNSNRDVVTGESVTVKGSQLAYLAPSEILGDEFDVDGFTNPVEVTDENKTNSILSSAHVPVKWNEPVQAWGGKTLNDLAGLGIEINKTDPVKKVLYPAPGSGTYAYFYLNFAADATNTNDTNASKYMQFYYQNNGIMKTNMDNYFSFYFSDLNSGIKVNDEEAYVRYITNGNLLSYGTKDEIRQGELYNPVDSNTSAELKNKSVVYRLMWYALNRKMVTNWGETYLNRNEAAYNRSVFDNLVNEPKMIAFLEQNYPNTDDGEKCVYPSTESGEMPKVIMCNNQGKNTLKITSELQKDLRLVICTGDVEIEKNVQFQGIIMAKGRITLNSGSSLQASPIEATNVFQMQMGENSDLKPQDFFWNGDDYVRGNSSSDDNTSGKDSSDVLDLSDYVFYQNWKKQ